MIIRPVITSGFRDKDVPHISRQALIDILSLQELDSLDQFIRDTDAPRPAVPGSSTRKDVYPWIYIQWRRWYEEIQKAKDE